MKNSLLRAGTRTRRFTALSVGLALAAGATLSTVTAIPAQAVVPVIDEVQTSTIMWEEVGTWTGIVRDARPQRYTPEIAGWADNTFNGIGYFLLREGDREWSFAADSEGTKRVNQGGTSTLTLTGNTGSALVGNYTVTATLTFEGNDARLSYAITGDNPAGVTAFFGANLISGDDTKTEVVKNTLLTWSERARTNPVLGVTANSNGSAPTFNPEESGPGEIIITTTGASEFSTTVLVQDFVRVVESSQQSALSFVRSKLPTSDATFGEQYTIQEPSVLLDDVTVDADVPVNQDLSAAFDETLTALDYFNIPGFLPVIHVSDLPAGLNLTATANWESGFPDPTDDSAENEGEEEAVDPMTFTLTGTPTKPGVYTVPVTVYLIQDRSEPSPSPSADPEPEPQALFSALAANDENAPGTYPVDTTVQITVKGKAVEPTPTPSPSNSVPTSPVPTPTATDGSVPPVITSPEATPSQTAGTTGPTLPHTGAGAAGLALPISVLIALGAVLYLGARRRRAAN
ncbi:hypothetical protein D9V32_00810 [Mycetocola tolaasinivorans]|uniref:LPXTG cell wall anchor domain-containing protein n=1 Tax=Mycetocola tolaasinivorans TaxID=76635 RepID=A0A3L7AD10_9MICO|nr:hypothetical protein [Mycetocola tolaasinivorans]RLP77905.1 hypothetical protein D9V32_00810 [Mycetocola tolaasinivorans]